MDSTANLLNENYDMRKTWLKTKKLLEKINLTNAQLKGKLRRRNMQIKDLKEEIKKMTKDWNVATERDCQRELSLRKDNKNLCKLCRNIWTAIEDGTIDESFFKLRAAFRRICKPFRIYKFEGTVFIDQKEAISRSSE